AVPPVGALEHRAPGDEDRLGVARRRLAVARGVEAARSTGADLDDRRGALAADAHLGLHRAGSDRLADLDGEEGPRRLAGEAHRLPEGALPLRVALAQNQDELVFAVAGEIHELRRAHVARALDRELVVGVALPAAVARPVHEQVSGDQSHAL